MDTDGTLAMMVVAIAASMILDPQGTVDPGCTLEKVCVDGYSTSVRPPSYYTGALKRQQVINWRLAGGTRAYEEDHFIPLELCGSPRDEKNLWPEPIVEARKKDKDELRLHKEVCDGELTLEEAQKEIRSKWTMHE